MTAKSDPSAPVVPAWVYERAACADTPAWLRAVFRGDDTDPEAVEVAKEICGRCPVFGDCHDAVMQVRHVDLPGVWAQTAEADRSGRKNRTQPGQRGRPRKTEEAQVA